MDKEKLMKKLIDDYDEIDKLSEISSGDDSHIFSPNDFFFYEGQLFYIRSLIDSLKYGDFDDKEN